MTKYREILRLTALGLSQRNIVQSIGVSQKTVVKVQKRAREMHLSWPLDENLTDAALETLMFPKESKVSKQKRMPDFNYIQKELLRNGVNKKLLWTEYLEECRQSSDEPLMYSQFCYYIQQDEQKRRATMHINRKPGEQIEVDWAGDPEQITDPDTGEIIPAFLFVGVMTYSQYPYVEAFINEKQRSWITAPLCQAHDKKIFIFSCPHDTAFLIGILPPPVSVRRQKKHEVVPFLPAAYSQKLCCLFCNKTQSA